MDSTEIEHYLLHHHIPFHTLTHPRAVGAQYLAHSLHVSGRRIGKTVVVDADGQPWLAVLPATSRVDTERLAKLLNARRLSLLSEAAASRLIDCEVGAEPPLGHLFQLPVVVDESLCGVDDFVFRDGSHERCIEMRYDDFAAIENPKVGAFTKQPD